MATILGSCGCGCGGGCEPVTSNCNFVLRKYDNNTRADVSWTSEATEEEIACFNEAYGCPNISFEYRFSVCTGKGEIYRAGGGGSGGGNTDLVCTILSDEGSTFYVSPCVDTTTFANDLSNIVIFNMYDFGQNTGELANTSIAIGGVTYDVQAGKVILPDDQQGTPSDSAPQAASAFSSEAVAPMNSMVLLGTFTQQYTDESIDFDYIDELAPDPNSTIKCKFSYNFSFTPEDGVDYYVLALPCDEAQSYPNVALAPDGHAYFNAIYNENTKMCDIVQAYVLSG